MNNRIVLKGDPIRKEAVVGIAVTPGYLVEFDAVNALQPPSEPAGNARKAFAVVADLVGGDVDDAYAVDDTGFYVIGRSGDEIYAWLPAGAAAIVAGNALESNGDGTLCLSAVAEATVNTERDGIVAYAMEAVDNSGGAAPVRIRVEVA